MNATGSEFLDAGALRGAMASAAAIPARHPIRVARSPGRKRAIRPEWTLRDGALSRTQRGASTGREHHRRSRFFSRARLDAEGETNNHRQWPDDPWVHDRIVGDHQDAQPEK